MFYWTLFKPAHKKSGPCNADHPGPNRRWKPDARGSPLQELPAPYYSIRNKLAGCKFCVIYMAISFRPFFQPAA
jgi:hypothetical protein